MSHHLTSLLTGLLKDLKQIPQSNFKGHVFTLPWARTVKTWVSHLSLILSSEWLILCPAGTHFFNCLQCWHRQNWRTSKTQRATVSRVVEQATSPVSQTVFGSTLNPLVQFCLLFRHLKRINVIYLTGTHLKFSPCICVLQQL